MVYCEPQRGSRSWHRSCEIALSISPRAEERVVKIPLLAAETILLWKHTSILGKLFSQKRKLLEKQKRLFSSDIHFGTLFRGSAATLGFGENLKRLFGTYFCISCTLQALFITFTFRKVFFVQIKTSHFLNFPKYFRVFWHTRIWYFAKTW
jgi:hypothetical protein